MRNEGDPPADQVIQTIYARGQREAVNVAFRELFHNPSSDNLPSEVRQFLSATSDLPEWADLSKIAHAENFFMSWGALSLASLAAASLPECYVLKEEGRVLAITQNLTRRAPSRIMETAQLVVDVMQKGGLGPKGRGIMAAQRVRLLHAAMRMFLLQEPPAESAERSPQDRFEAMQWHEWPKDFGMPISQEQIAYTLLTFSYVVPRSLERFGAKIEPDDWIAHLHCWNVVGHIMGLRRDLMAETKEEARDLFEKIKARHHANTAEGRALTRATINWMKGVIPFHFMDSIVDLVVWMLLDETTALSLDVGKPGALGRFGIWLYKAIPFRIKPNRVFGRWIVGELTAMSSAAQRRLFDLPASLEQAWRVKRKKPAGDVLTAPVIANSK